MDLASDGGDNMSQTRSQRRKQQKVKDRSRKIKKKHNLQQSAAEKRYRLDVFLEGSWRIGVRSWPYMRQVKDHLKDTDVRRGKGEEIIPGRVIDMRTGSAVLEIAGSNVKGAAPDKITDGVKAADVEEKSGEKEKIGSKIIRILNGDR